MKIGILSLGCPRNLTDSEALLGALNLKGFPIVDINDADIGIVNTCAFIEEAKKESIDAILDLIELKKEGKLKKIIVFGCLAQRYKEKLAKELPEVDCFIGAQALKSSTTRFALTPKHFAYLKICEGCVNSCTYCVIPAIKGKLVSLPIEDILRQAAIFDKQRISELNIIGQDITGYGLDIYGKRKLPELLKQILKVTKHIGWIRLLYLYPDKTLDEVLKIINQEDRLCKYVDLPVQHINDRILKLMNRRTDKQTILRLINKIRNTYPKVALRTSVIVGFPSETDKEFKELLKFIEDVQFERLGAFIYSQEEGTPAFSFKKQIPKSVKEERLNAVMLLQQKISTQVNRSFLDKTIDVLIDEKDEGRGLYLGRTQIDAPEVDGLVYVRSERKLQPGDFVKVRITDTMEYDLSGEVIK